MLNDPLLGGGDVSARAAADEDPEIDAEDVPDAAPVLVDDISEDVFRWRDFARFVGETSFLPPSLHSADVATFLFRAVYRLRSPQQANQSPPAAAAISFL